MAGPTSSTGTPEGFTTRVNDLRPIPATFSASTSTAKAPAAVGFPEIKPVCGSIESPDGKPLAPKRVGWLLADRASDQLTETVALRIDRGANSGGEAAAMVIVRTCVELPRTLLA